MFKRLIVLITLGLLVSGCFMGPMAFIGPATSGFTTASIAQSGATSAANYVFKQKTGKGFVEHALYSINKKKSEAMEKEMTKEKNKIGKRSIVCFFIEPVLELVFCLIEPHDQTALMRRARH